MTAEALDCSINIPTRPQHARLFVKLVEKDWFIRFNIWHDPKWADPDRKLHESMHPQWRAWNCAA